jgi:hypothetical protein
VQRIDPGTEQPTGTLIHPWYDRHVFIGYTKPCRGRASEPDPYKKISYHQSTYNLFRDKVYLQSKPPITTYYKLHLQRGQAAREAQNNGVANYQLANHGGWNQGDVLNDKYLVGAPMEMIRHQAGYQPKLSALTKSLLFARGWLNRQ